MPSIRSAFVIFIGSSLLAAAEPTAAQLETFEARIRPLLAEHCLRCHGGDTKKEPKGGLRLDTRAALLKGGDTGPAIVPGQPKKSLLIEAVKYGNVDLLMPPKGKLSDSQIADLEAWIADGAAWPKGALATVGSAEFDLAARKKAHWAWSPLKRSTGPIAPLGGSIEKHLAAGWAAKQLVPAKPAEPLVWLRRATFAITGLPPTPEEIAAFEADPSPESYARVADRLLASSRYGERWARHWLDLVRYAETRGHEFEPELANAFQYRDTVIRAFNADVPYDRFVREHLAGDALSEPRIDPKSGVNESLLAAGFWHLGEEVHSPVDLRQDQADRFDNRIDVATKTFLGLTVACARCHDHKFDAIGTKDYYSLYGLLEGSTYRQARIDGWAANRAVLKDLDALRAKHFPNVERHEAERNAATKSWLAKASVIVDYANLPAGHWLPDDVSYGTAPRRAGSITIVEGKPKVEPLTAAVFDPFWSKLGLAKGTMPDFGPLGAKLRAGFSIRTPLFKLEKKRLYYLVRGAGTAYAGVGQHTVLAGPLHGGLLLGMPNAEGYRWVGHDLSNYVGQRLHVEFAAEPTTPFAVALAVQSDDPPPDWNVPFGLAPAEVKIEDFAKDAAKLAERVVWDSRLAPTFWDGPPLESPVFVRGNPRSPGAIVPPRSLEAFDGAKLSGRVALAEQWTDPAKVPLVPRVMVNRIWHHLFGAGLVPSTDNFGVLGEAPTHPELLDLLADRFVREGWSIKKLIRELVLSTAFRRSSTPDAKSAKADPGNVWFHAFRTKRLEGEAIRDAALAISGRLDGTMFGPSVPIHLTAFHDGRGKPGASGPVDGDGRRTIYIAVRRNFLSPFLLAFDTPSPFSTMGRRTNSNVPAQSLALLNDPFFHEQAEHWAKSILKKPGTTEERIRRMIVMAYGRAAKSGEIEACAALLDGRESDPKAWTELAHALFNKKEFLFVK